jgi:ADP-ribosylglycohydrolase
MAYFNIGNFYSHLRDYKKASEWFEKSAEIDPNAPDTFYRLGKCYRESGEKEKEFDAYLNAVELAPDFVDAMFALGTVYAHLTDTDEGKQVPYFETGGDLVLSDPRVSFYLGLGNLALGNVDEARESQVDLRKMDERIADQLQFFIDRFDSENKNADDILKDNIPNSAELLKEKRKSFKVKVGETIIEAQNTPELYRQVMTLLFDRGLLQNAHVPFATSSTRYLIAKEPVHPSGKNFFKFVEYAGFYMETNKSRHDAVSHLKKFVETLQVEFENLEDGIPIRVTPPVKKQNTQPTVEQRFLGSLLGLAVGDALGTTVEFKPTGTFPRVTTITGGGPFVLNTGEWTDDTSMALCLADSLIESAGFDPVDQMRRYCRWKNEGYLSSNGIAFDIGNTVRRALEKFEQQANGGETIAYCGSVSPSTAGNGSLMRLAPMPLFFTNEAEKAIKYAGESSRTTHGARECVDACRYFAALIIGAIQGKSKEEILSPLFTPLPGLWEEKPLAAKVAEIAAGSFKSTRPPQISGSIQGYVIPSLHAALWAFYHTDSFADGALRVVNLGYDADTYGAIYGQIAGAYYGAHLIPEEWLNLIAKRDLIESVAEKLYKASASGG